jgi:hypothetical protein
MHFARMFVAFLVGILLYQTAVVYVGGIMAAVAIPTSYFGWFGREHHASALALLHSGFALPVAVLTAGGTLAAVRLIRAKQNSALWLVFFGLLTCYLFYVAIGALHVLAIGGEPLSFLKQVLLPPWWALPSAIAPWAGFGLATWALRRREVRDA